MASTLRISFKSRVFASPFSSPWMSRKSTCAKVVFLGLNMADRRSSRGSGTLATPTFGSTLPEAYLSTATWAPVKMLKRVVLPTLAKPSRPIFTTRLQGSAGILPADTRRRGDEGGDGRLHGTRVGARRGMPSGAGFRELLDAAGRREVYDMSQRCHGERHEEKPDRVPVVPDLSASGRGRRRGHFSSHPRFGARREGGHRRLRHRPA